VRFGEPNTQLKHPTHAHQPTDLQSHYHSNKLCVKQTHERKTQKLHPPNTQGSKREASEPTKQTTDVSKQQSWTKIDKIDDTHFPRRIRQNVFGSLPCLHETTERGPYSLVCMCVCVRMYVLRVCVRVCECAGAYVRVRCVSGCMCCACVCVCELGLVSCFHSPSLRLRISKQHWISLANKQLPTKQTPTHVWTLSVVCSLCVIVWLLDWVVGCRGFVCLISCSNCWCASIRSCVFVLWGGRTDCEWVRVVRWTEMRTQASSNWIIVRSQKGRLQHALLPPHSLTHCVCTSSGENKMNAHVELSDVAFCDQD